MVRQVSSSEMSREARAAFGEDATIIELEESDLKEPDEEKYPMEDLLEEGDYIEYETRSGKIICGTVTEVKSYAFKFNRDKERCGIGCGYTSFSSFGGERGQMLELLTVNGEEVDIQYEPK